MSENARQVELARETLKVFAEQGEQFDDVRHVIHYFYGGDFAALGQALRDLGYSVQPTADEEGVVAERQEAIGEEWRTSTLSDLCALADTYGVEYDGWEASMTRQTAPEPQAAARQSGGLFSKLFGKKN